ncbi:7192_t:CDS:2 [Rhizophagus irregularis]|nr:7192_t:CDS:2 [Rhizophagus irregularis]
MSLKFTLLSESSVKTIEKIQRAGFLPDPVQADHIHIFRPEWKNLKDDRIIAEWDQEKETILYLHDGGYYFLCKESHPINYRLTSQNQFPTALQDAFRCLFISLEDMRFEPLNPKKYCNSAGGGLSLLLVLLYVMLLVRAGDDERFRDDAIYSA